LTNNNFEIKAAITKAQPFKNAENCEKSVRLKV
jgi:hypothetical protein